MVLQENFKIVPIEIKKTAGGNCRCSGLYWSLFFNYFKYESVLSVTFLFILLLPTTQVQNQNAATFLIWAV